MIKLPKAPHILGSKAAKNDAKLDQFETTDLLDNRLLFQEKLDGYNVQLYFTQFGKLSIKHGNRTVPAGLKYAQLRNWATDKESLLLNVMLCLLMVQYRCRIRES